jgi:hypothetical protein
MKQLGRQGSGPGEYMTPGRVFPLSGDSFAIQDLSNARMLVVKPDGTLGEFLDRFGAPATAAVSRSRRTVPQQADGRGFFYAQVAASATRRTGAAVRTAGAAPVLRWHASSAAVDTAALVPVPTWEQTGETGPGGMVIRRPPGPFSTRAQWAVARDGSIAVVQPNPYRVDVIGPSGARRRGPVVPVTAIRVSEAHKAAWREEAAAPRITVVGTPDGRRSVQARSWPVQEHAEWPRVLPPFLYDAVQYAPDGRVWVARTTPAGGMGAFDVFDGSGRPVERVRVPANRRLLGFGRSAVYLAYRDEVDLEYVERYR